MIGIRSKRIILPGEMRDGLLMIKHGKIHDLLPWNAEVTAYPVEDVGHAVLMPGIIDSHVHINEPGRTEWEGFDTATRAAAAGGITSLVDMPLNSSPVTTTLENFREKLKSAEGKIHVHCGFWGGVVPDNFDQLEALLEAGALGLKAFLTHSGIDDFPDTNEAHLRKALLVLKKYDKPLLVHCELSESLPDDHSLNKNPKSYAAYLSSRPDSWEVRAIELMIKLCRETGARVHIVHLATAEALPVIRAAKKDGLPLTVETAQHYLFFNAENIPDGDTRYKCAPPIRGKENQEKLWAALHEGDIDFIATDHSPAPSEMKELENGNLLKAWGGIAGLQFALPAVWTQARNRGFQVQDISRLLSTNIARFLKIKSKGRIAIGCDADLCVWNPEKKFKAGEHKIWHRHPVTPYLDVEMSGEVEQTWLNGYKIFDRGKFLLLNRGELILQSSKVV